MRRFAATRALSRAYAARAAPATFFGWGFFGAAGAARFGNFFFRHFFGHDFFEFFGGDFDPSFFATFGARGRSGRRARAFAAGFEAVGGRGALERFERGRSAAFGFAERGLVFAFG